MSYRLCHKKKSSFWFTVSATLLDRRTSQKVAKSSVLVWQPVPKNCTLLFWWIQILTVQSQNLFFSKAYFEVTHHICKKASDNPCQCLNVKIFQVIYSPINPQLDTTDANAHLIFFLTLSNFGRGKYFMNSSHKKAHGNKQACTRGLALQCTVVNQRGQKLHFSDQKIIWRS